MCSFGEYQCLFISLFYFFPIILFFGYLLDAATIAQYNILTSTLSDYIRFLPVVT